MALNATPTQAQRVAFCDYLEQQYEKHLKENDCQHRQTGTR